MSTDRSTLTPKEREKASVFHSWSAQSTIDPLMIKDAHGVYVTDIDGKTYLDFSSQLVNTNVGHQHPAVVKAIQDQAGVLCTIAPQHGYQCGGRTSGTTTKTDTSSKLNPSKSQGRPNENHGLEAHRSKRPTRLRSPKQEPLSWMRPNLGPDPDRASERQFHASITSSLDLPVAAANTMLTSQSSPMRSWSSERAGDECARQSAAW